MIVARTRATEDDDEVNLFPGRKIKRGLENLRKLKKRNGSCDEAVDVDLNVNVTTSRITESRRSLSNVETDLDVDVDLHFPTAEYDDDEDAGISLTPSSSASMDDQGPETPTASTSIGIDTEDLNFNEMEEVHQGHQDQGQQDTNSKFEVEAPEDFLGFTEEEAEEILSGGNVSDESFKSMLEEEFILPDIKAEDDEDDDDVDHLADNNSNNLQINNDDVNLLEDRDSKNVIQIQGDDVDDDEIMILEELPAKKRGSVIVTPPKKSKAPPQPHPPKTPLVPEVEVEVMGGDNDIEILDLEDPLQIPGDSTEETEKSQSQGQPPPQEPEVEVEVPDADAVPGQSQGIGQPPLQVPPSPSNIEELEGNENEPQPQEPEADAEVPDAVPSQSQGQSEPQLPLPSDIEELKENETETMSSPDQDQDQNEIQADPQPEPEPEVVKENPNENLLWDDEFLDLIGPITDVIDPAELTVALDMVDKQRELELEGVPVDEVDVEANLEMNDDLDLDTEEKENVPPAPVPTPPPAQILPLPLDPNAEPIKIKRVETKVDPLPSCFVRVTRMTPGEIENYLKSTSGKRKLPLIEAANNQNNQSDAQLDGGATTPPKPKKPRRSHSLLKKSDWWSSRRSRRRRSRSRAGPAPPRPARPKQSTSTSKPTSTWSPLECLFCGKVCSTKTTMQYHIHRHTEERPYECKFCNHAFFSGPVLWLHLKTKHPKKKPKQKSSRLPRPPPRRVVPPPPPAEDTDDDYEDDLFVPERVKVNLSLSENFRIKNNQIYEWCKVPLERVPPLDLWEQTTSARKLSWKEEQRCPFCSRVFPTRSAIQLHIGKIHTRQDQMRLRCPLKSCKRGFTFRWEVKQHVEKFHPSHQNQPPPPPPVKKLKPKTKVKVEPPTAPTQTQLDTIASNKATGAGEPGTQKCPKCPKTFKTLSQLNRHMTLCQNLGLQRCPERGCSYYFKSGDDKAVGDHMFNAHKLLDDRAFRCDICLRKFGNEHTLNRHRRQFHKTAITPMPKCRKSSSRTGTSQIAENPPKEQQVHRCPNPQCKETFNTRKRLRLHLAVEHTGFKEPPPPKKSLPPLKIQTAPLPPPMPSPKKLSPPLSSPTLQFPSTSKISVPPPPLPPPEMIVVARKSPPPLPPPEMIVVARKSLPPPPTPTTSALVLPPPPASITEAQPEASASTSTAPGQCGRRGGTPKEKKVKPNSKPSRKSLGVGPSPKISICLFCGKDMKSYYLLELHMNVHSNEKPYECSKCSKMFPYASSLWVHEKKTHGEKLIQCEAPDCSMTFATQSDLKNHRETRHPQTPPPPPPPVYVDIDPIAADAIRLTFRLKWSYTLLKWAWLRQTNQAEVVRKKVWDFWRQRRRWNWRMRLKMKGIAFRLMPWPMFGCHICVKMFRSRTQLNGHLRRDHPRTNLKHNKHYQCSQCRKGFFTMTEINRHLCKPRKSRKPKSGSDVIMILPRPAKPPGGSVGPPEVVVEGQGQGQGHPQLGQGDQAESGVKEPQAPLMVASGGGGPEVVGVGVDRVNVTDFFRSFI